MVLLIHASSNNLNKIHLIYLSVVVKWRDLNEFRQASLVSFWMISSFHRRRS